VSVDLPASGEALTILQVESNGAQVKYQSMRILNDLYEQGDLGTPVTPPPGQGCYLPDQQGHGASQVLAATSDRNASVGYEAAECFCPLQDSNLTHAVWWGGYYDFLFGSDCGPGQGDDFRITYYDNNGGVPGNVIASFDVGLAQKFATGNDYIGIINEWQFQSTFHAPVPVSAGTCYWISISNNSPPQSSTLCVWLWGTAPPGDGAAAQTDPVNWLVTDYDLAVCVSAQIDPAGTCQPPVVAPANDDCANCEAISGEGNFPFDNTNASTDNPGTHAACDFFGSTVIDNDVWYCWTAPCTDTVTLTTVGNTSVDTKIAVYDSTACPPSEADLLVCNDDSNGTFQTEVQFAATSGSVYLICLGTFPGASGGVGSFDISCGAPSAPANDDCANAAVIAIGGIDSGDTTLATADVAPFCDTSDGTGGGVWYQVTGNGNQLVASLCSGNTLYDSKLRVYCGSCAGLVCVAGNDDTCGLQSEVVWDTDSGVDYLILVHGFSGSVGPYELGVFDNGPNVGTPVACSSAARMGMTVTSNLPNVFVGVDPVDDYTQGAGLTPFERFYAPDTMVTLTFPTQVDSKALMGYLVNGKIIRGPQGGVLTGKASKAQKVKAIYTDGDSTPGGPIDASY
jgi:hypothetical protein